MTERSCQECYGPLSPFDEDFCEWCEPEEEDENE